MTDEEYVRSKWERVVVGPLAIAIYVDEFKQAKEGKK